MTDLTPTQIESLNRVIAEFDGWLIRDFSDRKLLMVTYKGEPGEGFDYSGLSSGGIDKAMYHAMSYLPNYTSSLDAIVPVVQRWLNNLIGSRERFYDFQDAIAQQGIFTTNRLLMNDNPALAVCIAFAKAAGLEWEK